MIYEHVVPFFFLKLFSNGMKESEQRHVKLRITASGM